MTPMDNLDQALAALDPQIQGQYVFASTDRVPEGLEPFAVIREPEGLTLVILEAEATEHGLETDHSFTLITAGAQTSLNAVGITATVTSTIASRGIPCNVIAGAFHDHFFVPSDRADEALSLLQALAAQAEGWITEDGEWD